MRHTNPNVFGCFIGATQSTNGASIDTRSKEDNENDTHHKVIKICNEFEPPSQIARFKMGCP